MQMLSWSVLLCSFLVACGSSSPPPGTGGTSGMAAGVGGGGVGGGGVGGGGVGGGGVGGNCPTGVTFAPGTDAGRNMVGVTEICQRLSEIQCAAERCCCPDGNARKYATVDACVSQQRSICLQIQTESIAGDSRTGFSSARLADAFAEFEQLAATCDTAIVNWGTSQEGFASVLSGTVSSGGVCWQPVMDGQDAAAIASCGTVNACLGASIITPQWKCGPRLNAGGRCLVDPSCADALFCDPLPTSSQPALGTCKARLPIDAACTRASQCASLFCIGGHCAPANVEAAYCLKP